MKANYWQWTEHIDYANCTVFIVHSQPFNQGYYNISISPQIGTVVYIIIKSTYWNVKFVYLMCEEKNLTIWIHCYTPAPTISSYIIKVH